MGWSEEDERQEVEIIARIKIAYEHAFESGRLAGSAGSWQSAWQEYLLKSLHRETDPTQPEPFDILDMPIGRRPKPPP
jgi:hypothetical protein